MNALAILIDQIVNIYIWTLLAYIIVGWLIAFRIINPWQPAVRMIVSVLGRIHEPILGRIRQFLPDLGGIDISPIVVFLGVQFIRNLVVSWLATGY
ncbi:YggT family protein [Alphaproteobacteria bacterium]|jgi:YggT family protein|nr:YggT family protein [Alphaproteobacteria bacterium]